MVTLIKVPFQETMDAVQHLERSPIANDPQTGNDPQIGPQMIPDVETRNGMEFGFFVIIMTTTNIFRVLQSFSVTP